MGLLELVLIVLVVLAIAGGIGVREGREGEVSEDDHALLLVGRERGQGAPEAVLPAEVLDHLELPDPERQVPISPRGTRVTYYADFVFRFAHGPDLDVEIDGLEAHGTPKAHDHDLMRDQLIASEGYEVRRFAAWRVERDRYAVCRGLLQAFRGERPLPARLGA